MIAHDSANLDLKDPRNWRTRTSAHVRIGDFHVQIDAAPEFRLQCIHNDIRKVDAFILTHGHADHVLGMDDLRRFIDLRGGNALPVYGTTEGLDRVKSIFPYAIRDKPVFKGYPAFQLKSMPETLNIPGGKIQSCLLPHGSLEVLGLVFEESASNRKLAYYTDCKRLTDRAIQLAEGADVVVLDALRPMLHPAHMSIDEAIEAARTLGAPRTYFTHMTFMIDHERDGAKLPKGIHYAYDGLRVEV